MSSFIMFIILTSLLGPSIICTGFLLYQFIRSSELRKKSQNFLVICLLIVNSIQEILELPSRLYFLYTRVVLFPNPYFCNFWNWCQFTLTTVNLSIIALGSIERYLLIFNHIIFTRNIRFLQRISLISCIIIPSIFYAICIYAIQCETVFNYRVVGCGLPCSFSLSKSITIFKNIVFIILPVIITILISCSLIIRIYIQRKKLKRQRQFWRESIQMFAQLFPIIILYLIIWIPLGVLFYFITFGTIIQRPIASSLINDYFGNLKYLVNLIYPFLVLSSQKKFREKLKKIFGWSNPRINPTVARMLPLAYVP